MPRQLRIPQKPLRVKLVSIGSEDIFVEVELAVGDEDEGTGLEGFVADDCGGIDAAGGLRGYGEAEDFVEQGFEAGAGFCEAGEVDHVAFFGDGAVGFLLDGGVEGGVVEEVGEEPEAEFVGVCVDAVVGEFGF